jgi:hypothetical protein
MPEDLIKKCKFDFNQGDDPNMSCDKENPKCTNYIESKQFGKLGTCFNPLKSSAFTTAVDLENFKLEYRNALRQYKKAQQDWKASIDGNNMKIIPDSKFTGSKILSTLDNSSQNECEASCSSIQDCKGATFDESNNKCILYNDNGSISKSTNKTAILSEVVFQTNKLEKFNSKLNKINESILKLINTKGDMQFKDLMTSNHTSKQQMIELNKDLKKERIKINDVKTELNAINNENEIENLYITKNFYSYLFLFLLAIVCIIGILIISYNTNNNSNNTNQNGGSFFDNISI